MPQIRLKDVANILGLSNSTVSKALNDSFEISDETKRKVQHTARLLNYTPNQVAVNLRKKHTKTIGVIIPTMVHHFFSKIIDGIIERAEKDGYLVIILQSNESISLEKKQVNLLIDKRVDGILISLSNETNEFVHLKKILSRNIPLILFDKIEPSIACSKVKIDDFEAAYSSVVFLIKKGYKKIAHFRGDFNPKNSVDRFNGYKQALLDNNIDFDPSLVFLCDNNSDFEDGYSNAKKLISDKIKVDAIFAITDLIAIGAIKYLKEQQIKVPEEIAVFGFSNWFMSSVISPTLSTVDQPAYKMGKVSMEILLDEIRTLKDNKTVTHKEIILPTKLVIRNSC